MKSFLDLVQEDKSSEKHHVMTFGRMNPPTTGHLKLIDKVKEIAHKQGATHSVVTSHSQDSKKNPLSAEQKVKHLKRYSPGTHFQASSKEHPTFLHHAAELHKKGVTHLHMVVGSDRVEEMKEKLHKYNGTHEGALYNFKKIHVHSAGHRDPDAEGTTGMSGTKMREHAKNKDVKSFKQGVPSHVSDAHAKELMHDTRKGMGLHESTQRGLFKAIFVTGGPGSGKDIIIRECIAESRAVELNTIQAVDYLSDKQKLSEKTGDFRREAIRNRGPLIINGPADDHTRILSIKEELEELGYETMMVFVNTTNEASKERNEKLTKMISESVRQQKWEVAQNNERWFNEQFTWFKPFDNTGSFGAIEESVTNTYRYITKFIETKSYNDVAFSWLENHGKLNINETFKYYFKEQTNVKQDSRSIRFGQEGGTGTTTGTRSTRSATTSEGTTQARRFNFHKITESVPTLTVSGTEKTSNFSKDKESEKLKKLRIIGTDKLVKTSGLGPEYDSRQSGNPMNAGGLGDALVREGKDFSSFRRIIKEAEDGESGLAGVMGNASNKENMETLNDKNNSAPAVSLYKKNKKGAK